MPGLPLAAVLLLFVAGCASTGPTAPTLMAGEPIAQGAPATTEETMAPDADNPSLRALLERSLTDLDLRGSLDLLVECRDEAGMRAMRVWGDGLGVWQGRRQFHLGAKGVPALLERLAAADFAAFAPLYGGPREEDPRKPERPEDDSAVMVVCRIRVSLAGESKESVQRAKGDQSAELKALAESLLAVGQASGARGVEAESLRDGLEKIGLGELDPRVMELMVHRRPTAAEAEEGGPGFLLRLQGRKATTRRHEPQFGYGDEMRLDLDLSTFQDLALILADLDPAALPANLWAPAYTDLNIELLDQRKSIQARRFAGLEAETHGALQKDFDALYRTLSRLQRRVEQEGTAKTD